MKYQPRHTNLGPLVLCTWRVLPHIAPMLQAVMCPLKKKKKERCFHGQVSSLFALLKLCVTFNTGVCELDVVYQ